MKFINDADFLFKLTPRLDRGQQEFKGIGITTLNAIDGCVKEGIFSFGKSDSLSGGLGDQPGNQIVKLPADLNVAISGIRGVLGETGISIVVLGEEHTYQQPKPSLAPLSSLDEMMMDLIANNEVGGFSQRDILRFQQKFAERNLQAQNLAPLIDFWNLSDHDRQRGDTIAELAGGGVAFPKADLVVLERGLSYQTPFDETIMEDVITGSAESGWSIKMRSAIISAFIFLCVAGGQSANDRVLVFFGEEHAKDILKFFEFFALNSAQIGWVKTRKRSYCMVRSHIPKTKTDTI